MRIWGSAGTLAVLGLLLAAPASGAATIAVSTKDDAVVANDGLCSLREAVTAENTGLASGAAPGECPAGRDNDTIALAAGSYKLTHGALFISSFSSFGIKGAGAGSTAIDGTGGTDRILDVHSGAITSLSDLTVTGGHAPDGAAGGDESDGSPGQPGGGIRNLGTLTLTQVDVSGNHAGNGGAGGFSITNADHAGGSGGDGGGIYNTGLLTVNRSNVSSNRAGDGGFGSQGMDLAGTGGLGGSGGGILSVAGASLTITSSTVSANRAGSGGPGRTDTRGGIGGAGGTGGGVRTSGSLTLTGSTISGNVAGHGGNGGDGDHGAAGVGGNGGGLFNAALAAQTISNDTLTANSAGSGGDGGADSGGGVGGNAGNGAGGGGLVNGGGTLVLVDVTVASNLVGAPGRPGLSLTGTNGNPGVAGGGGGIVASGSTPLQNTIVANNSGANCLGTITDGGHDLTFPDRSCPGVNANPRLGPLADNGGPTATMALLAGSAAIDHVPATGAGCPATDQRGVTRPQGAACDIGAFEAGVPVKPLPPAISGLALHPSAFVASAHGASIAKAKRHPTGTNVTYRDSLSATTTFTVLRAVKGMRRGHACVKLARGAKHPKRCTRYVKVGGFSHRDRAGRVTFHFSGRVRGHKLSPGSYKLTAVPRVGRTAGRAATVRFRITR